MTNVTSQSDLLKRLHAVLLKQRFVLFSAGLVTTLGAVVATAILLSLFAQVMVLPVWFKIALMTAAGLGALLLFVRFALVRIFDGNIDNVAVGLETRHPELKGRLIAAVQFARTTVTPGYSSELIAANERQAIERAGLINFNEVLTFHPVLRSGKLLAVSVVLAVALLVLFPGFFSYSYEVYSNPTTEIAPPLAYRLVAVPGSTEWIKYRDLTIGASLIGQRIPREATVHYRLAGGTWQKESIDLARLNRAAIAEGDSLAFGVTLRQVNKSLDYYVEAGRLKSTTEQINVVDRPRVDDIKLSIFYPEYSKLPPTTLDENNGSFSALTGSRVNLRIESNLPVQSAELVYADSSRVPFALEGITGELSLVVEKSRSYHVRLTDHLNEINPDPIEYYITAVPDEYPSVDVVRPGYDANLSDDMVLPLLVRIYDDFGFSSLVMKYTVVNQGRTSEEHVAVLHFSDNIKTEGDVEFNWDLDRLNLFPGDYVSYHFEIADNDVIGGPKIGVSRTYIARLPSLEEIIAQTENQGQERISKTEELLKASRDLSERLKKSARKLQAQNRDEKSADWDQKKELESITKKNEEVVDNLEKLAEQMDQSVEEMKKDALMSREIMEKLEQLQKLFEEVATPEMREAQKKLMEALKNMDREELQKALKDFEMSQDDMLQRLERQLALLKKMQIEQKMEAMLRQAEDLLNRQDQMNKDAEKADDQELPEMSQAEKDIKEGLEALKKEGDELQEMIQQAELGEVPPAEEFAQELKKSDAQTNMESMSQSMTQQQKKESVSEGKKASSKLAQMLDKMQQQMNAMKGDDSEKIRNAMRRAIEDANYLSREQEDLMEEASDLNPRSVMTQGVTTSQQDLIAATEGLRRTVHELGQASPFVASELLSIVADAKVAMDDALLDFGNRRGSQATDRQHEAMYNLNKAALRLMESMNQQSQCDKGGSCDKPMAALEQLSQQQNELNQKTQKECNNPKPGSEGDQAQLRQRLQELAGQQGAIRKSMEELEKEFGDSRQVLGRLADIAREMKEIEELLESGQAGEETAERQLRIYSRMLEAARSLQRRDFNEERRATTAETTPNWIPPSLPADLLNDREQFEDRLRRYLGDNYPAQYEEQIKAYFRALLNAEQQGPTPEPAKP
jgi:hypothetical protein